MRFQKFQHFRNYSTAASRPSFGARLRNWAGGLIMLGVLLALWLALEASRFGQVDRAGFAQAIDGDSLRLNGVEMRLKGVDAPEYNQICTDFAGNDTTCGRTARRALAELLRQGEVNCIETEKDRYGRALVTCSLHGKDIGAHLVKQGSAIAFGNYESEEAEARVAKRGLWAGSFERPADYRKRHPR